MRLNKGGEQGDAGDGCRFERVEPLRASQQFRKRGRCDRRLRSGTRHGFGDGGRDRVNAPPDRIELEFALAGHRGDGRRRLARGQEKRCAAGVFQRAPRTGGRPFRVLVRPVPVAGAQLAAQPLQSQPPVTGRRAAVMRRGRGEGALEQVRYCRGQGIERQGMRRRLHRVGGGAAAEREPIFLDGALDRHVALAPIAAGEGVSTHEQQVKAQQGEPEGIVVRGAAQAVKGPALQFGRGELRHADIARKHSVARVDLERVAVDQLDHRLSRHHHVTGIDIADDVAAGVDGLEGAGQVTRRVNQKRPVGVREGPLAVRGAVQAVNFAIAADLGHHEALDRAIRANPQHIHRPGGDLQQAGVRLSGHSLQLERFVRADRLMINLGDEIGSAGDFVDRAFAAAPQRIARLDSMAGAAIQPRHRRGPGREGRS